MIESVLVARDRWLKPNGVMYPSSARLLIAELDKTQTERATQEMLDDMSTWDDLTDKLDTRYSLRFDALRQAYKAEKFAQMFRTAFQFQMDKSVVVDESQVLLELDLHRVTVEQLFGWNHTLRLRQASDERPVHGLCGWFD